MGSILSILYFFKQERWKPPKVYIFKKCEKIRFDIYIVFVNSKNAKKSEKIRKNTKKQKNVKNMRNI